MEKNLILAIFFSVTGSLLFWGTKKDYKEINKSYDASPELPHYYREGAKSGTDRLRIISIVFILVGVNFIYNKIADFLNWYTSEDFFSLFLDWVF